MLDALAVIQFTASAQKKETKRKKKSLKARGQELNIFCIGNPLFPPHYL